MWLLAGQALGCELPGSLPRERAVVAQVQDGDSVRLVSGERVRLIGVNAPELAREGRPAQPLAQAAKESLKQHLSTLDEVLLVYDREREDHYGRTLAYVFTPSGESVEAALLREGLAFHIAIPPNTHLADCLALAQTQALSAGRGVWGHDGWQPISTAELTLEETGFQRLRGQVTDISEAGGSVWVELNGPLVLQVPAELWSTLKASGVSAGRMIEVRGWVVDRSGSRAARRGFKPLLMQIRSRYDISFP
ncbi:thermonuclease family protein [Marinimicrobium agarilyticum]|uniref:thermonuclease family protein n=1 Tax=Marinimicrobium agarilyticum TaxID=306546 RepID=UPI00041FDEDC|nr:thermonuclease family protein [Marinimicrobium agarilyticum]